jgi:hypothetical protein
MKALCLGTQRSDECLDCGHGDIHENHDDCYSQCVAENESIRYIYACETSPLRIAVFEALRKKGGSNVRSGGEEVDEGSLKASA